MNEGAARTFRPPTYRHNSGGPSRERKKRKEGGKKRQEVADGDRTLATKAVGYSRACRVAAATLPVAGNRAGVLLECGACHNGDTVNHPCHLSSVAFPKLAE